MPSGKFSATATSRPDSMSWILRVVSSRRLRCTCSFRLTDAALDALQSLNGSQSASGCSLSSIKPWWRCLKNADHGWHGQFLYLQSFFQMHAYRRNVQVHMHTLACLHVHLQVRMCAHTLVHECACTMTGHTCPTLDVQDFF